MRMPIKELELRPPLQERITEGCVPAEIISNDHIQDLKAVVDETTEFATTLMSNTTVGNHIINKRGHSCIWKKLIKNKTSYNMMSWTAVPGCPHIDAVPDKEAKFLFLVVGRPGVLVEER